MTKAIETLSGEDATRVLRARAQALARPPVDPGVAEGVDVLEFTLAGERYALRASDIDDVQPLRDLTPLPSTPPFLRGVVNFRGALIGVIDLKRFFDLPESGITDLHRVILLRHDVLKVGLLADTVESVATVDMQAVQTSLATLTGIREEYVAGITADRVVILDAGAILSDPRILVDESVDG